MTDALYQTGQARKLFSYKNQTKLSIRLESRFDENYIVTEEYIIYMEDISGNKPGLNYW